MWFGLISVIGLVSGFLLATYLLRRLKPTQPVRTVEILLATDVVLAVALLVFAFAESFWLALLAYLVARRARGLRAALASSAVLLLPALALYVHALRRGGRERVA